MPIFMEVRRRVSVAFFVKRKFTSSHAECIECMANSDNVIRAGLTPKLRDVPNLISGLTYSAAPPSKHVVMAQTFTSSSTSSLLYDPPIPEFSVVQVIFSGKDGKSRESHRAVEGPSVAIVTDGNGVVSWGINGKLSIGRGDVFFVSLVSSLRVTKVSLCI